MADDENSADAEWMTSAMLKALANPLRRRILPYLLRVRDELRIPIVYVSHDREEAEELADVVVTIEHGRISGIEPVRA